MKNSSISAGLAFPHWLERLRAGDPSASSELITRVTPILRRVVRTRIAQLRLHRIVDPLDICQTVLANFFARLTAEWPPADTAQQLIALILAIARNKIQDEARRHTAGRRDHRRINGGHSEERLSRVVDDDPSPSKQVAYAELYQHALRRLTSEERQLLEERIAGRSWAAIAADRGQQVDLLRQKLNRAVKRVRRQLIAEARQEN